MKKLWLTLPIIISAFAPQAFADNIAACEVILMETVEEDGKETQAQMASFRPAVDFLSSVYDDKEGYMTEVDGYIIRGVMCERKDVIPTLRDFPILATGLPFSLSQNFDSAQSSLMTVYYKEDRFRHAYKGGPLPEDKIAQLLDVMEVFNLQPHDLKSSKDMERLSAKKQKELE